MDKVRLERFCAAGFGKPICRILGAKTTSVGEISHLPFGISSVLSLGDRVLDVCSARHADRKLQVRTRAASLFE